MSLGEKIYKLRTGKRMSQEDFASAMEVSRQSVSKWENDMAVPELEKLIKMTKLFEVSLDELVGNAPPQPAPVPVTDPESTPVVQHKKTITFDSKTVISTGLLFAAVLLPIFHLLLNINTSYSNMLESLKYIPFIATGISALLVPQSKILYHAYQFFLIILTIILLDIASEGIWYLLVDWCCFAVWSYRRK